MFASTHMTVAAEGVAAIVCYCAYGAGAFKTTNSGSIELGVERRADHASHPFSTIAV